MATPLRPKGIGEMRPASTLEELYDDTRRLYESITETARRDKRKSEAGRRVAVKGKNSARRRL
jgi:hypothetical protein